MKLSTYILKTIGNNIILRSTRSSGFNFSTTSITRSPQVIPEEPKKILTLWQRIGTPAINIFLLGTCINIGLQAYWYDLYLEKFQHEKEMEILKLEKELFYLEGLKQD